MNETIALPIVVITMIMVFLSPTLFWMIKETIHNNKKIKVIDFKIGQKKEDKNFIDGYDCKSRFLNELIHGMACQKMTEDQQDWHDELVQYINDNVREYFEAKERLYGDNYVVTF